MFIAGDHVPDIPSKEVVGNGVMAVPSQNGPTGLNVDGLFGFMVTVIVVV